MNSSIKDFFSMLITPRQTIRRITQTNSAANIWTIILSWAALEISGGLLSDSSVLGEGNWTLLAGLAISMLFAFGLAAAYFYLNSWMVFGCGRMLAGKSNWENILAASAWSLAPMLAFSVLKILLLLPVQGYMPFFGTDVAGWPQWVMVIREIIGFGGLVCGLWSVLLFSRSLAEVQGYKTGWKGFWNSVLPWLIVGLVLFLIGMIVAIIIAGLKQNGAL